MKMDKLPEREIKIENKIVKWFKNYWYYYKWKVIIASFLIVVFVFCTAQMCSNTDSDMTIMYAGPFLSTSLEVPSIEEALSAMLPEDYNDDGKKEALLSMMTVYSPEQIEQIESTTEITIDRVNNNSELDKFQNLIVTGEHNLCLLDPWLYEMVKKENGFAKLEDAIGYLPESAVDEYAVKLSDTEFGKYFAGVTSLPEDTYICLRTPGALQTMVSGGKSEKFDRAAELLRAIVEFKAPN